ncbi:MAG TPA: hypothetical protein VN916_09395, partial [Candidatus Acidoferrum sp.]|nr:hypothetical protein [Candidatus Acidoferrum sp.]
ASREALAYAPGAVVIHERRATLAAYLGQQRGYGIGEGLLFRKYPLRSADEDGMYAGPSWLGSLFGGARVYYGEFGRGLFQTVYSAGNSYADLPLTIQWIGLSLMFLILGELNRLLGVLGAGGIALSILAAAASASSVPLPREHSGPMARIDLWIVNLLGPSVRSFARERVKWRFKPADAGDPNGPVKLSGQLEFVMSDLAAKIDSATILAAMRDALVRRGVAVAETDGFQSYDLELVVPPMIRVPINALRKDASVALIWRVRAAPRRALIAAAVIFVLLAACFSLGAGIVGVIIAALAAGLLSLTRARCISAIIKASAVEVAGSLGISLTRPEDQL